MYVSIIVSLGWLPLGKYLDKDDKSSLLAHTENNSHTIDFDNIKILDTEINNGKRLFSEAFFILQQKNYINKQFEINKLTKEYNILINNCESLAYS